MRRVLFAIVTAAAIITRAQEAFGQCEISTMDINGTLTLCAVDGNEWQWTGPGGLTATTPCIDAVVNGVYTLRVFDSLNGLWSAPCSYTVGDPPTAPTCAITGEDTVCAGSSTAWCAPSGDFTFAWSGPSGFGSGTQCAEVSVAGDYTLLVTDNVSGLTSEPCTKTLTVMDCTVPSGHPPCPEPPRWWSLACGTNASPIDETTFARIAAGVDQRSAVWTYGGTSDGLCAILRPGRHSGSFNVARRLYAAVLANLAAGDLDLRDHDGNRVGLDATMSLDGVPGVAAGTTLGEWVAATDAQMLTLAHASDRSRPARDELRRIQNQARELNAGWRQGGCALGLNMLADDPEDDDRDWSASAAVPPTSISFGASATQEPTAGSGRIRWTLQRSQSVELKIIDITGRSVRHLANGMFAAGTHDFSWDGRDDDGRKVHSGAYFVAGRVGDQRLSQRLFILR